MKNLLLFDFDGVVVDSLDVYEGTVRQCLEKIGQPLVKTRADFLALFEDNFYESLVKRGVNLAAFMEASPEILARVNYADMKPFYDLIPVLAALRQNHLLVIISSSGTEDIDLIMARYQLTDYFADVLGSDVNLSKKEKILAALERQRMPKEKTYYIGDTTGDIKEAKAVGVRTIAVTWGWHTREQLQALEPDYIIDRPGQLLAIPS